MAGGLDLDNALWRFALPFYAREGVSAACLTLQDKLGVDVNILLAATYAAVERGVTLDPHDLAALDALIRDWRSEVIQPLRRVRTRMKSGPAPAPSAVTEALRNRIKAAELAAEQIELAVLHDGLGERAPSTTPDASADAPRLVARYFGRQDTFTPDVDAALGTLSQAIRDVSAAKADHLS
jgi:uncharacterized protein (TIGR02444 family)